MSRKGARVSGLVVRAALLLAIALPLAGCASGSRGPRGPVRSPTGKIYELGTPPIRSRRSQTAALLLRQGVLDRALEIAEEGIAADSANPIHYFVAGLVQVRLGLYEDAHENFTIAQRIYPAYELVIEPEREAAWIDLYNAGTEAYDDGEIERAIAVWEQATLIYDLAPEAPRNLTSLYLRESMYEDAIRVSELALAGLAKEPATRILDSLAVKARQEAVVATDATLAQMLLFTSRYKEAEVVLRRQLARGSTGVQVQSDLASALTGQGRADEAAEIYSRLLAGEKVESTQLFELGVALFRVRDYQRASEAFARLTELRPNSRDVWFNYANTLFGAGDWGRLTEAASRLLEVDPLGEKSGLIVARALLEMGDREGALAGVERVEAVPIYVENLQMRRLDSATRIQGRAIGNGAVTGFPLTLLFTFYSDDRELGSSLVTVFAPPDGESTTFEVQYADRATAYRYELLR